MIRNSVEGIVLGRSRQQRRRTGLGTGRPARQSTFSGRTGGRLLLFFRTRRKAGSPFQRAGMAVAIHAKRKGGQAIENKQFCEMAHFALPMISRTYDQTRETVRFALRNESFRFCWFSASSRAKTQGSEINGGFGARAADVARLGHSGMAPQAVGIAQNGLGNDGVDGPRPNGIWRQGGRWRAAGGETVHERV